MRRILATVVLALAAALGLPAASDAGGATSVLITQPGSDAGALYVSDAAYDALLGLLPVDETRGKQVPPGESVADYNLTWLVHDVMPWRFDRVAVFDDGTAWVSTTFTEGAAAGWAPLPSAKKITGILDGVLDGSSAPSVVTIPAEMTPEVVPPAAAEEPRPARLSLAGWRWAVPGVLVGLVIGAVAARRPRDTEPRQVLISSEA